MVKSRTSENKERRPFQAGNENPVCLQTQVVGLGRVGAPLPGLTTGATDGHFVHENRAGSLHSKKYK